MGSFLSGSRRGMMALESTNTACCLECDYCTPTSLSNGELDIPTVYISSSCHFFFLCSVLLRFWWPPKHYGFNPERPSDSNIWDWSAASFHGEKPTGTGMLWAKAIRKAGAMYIHAIVYVTVISVCWFRTKIPIWNCFYGNNSEGLVFQLVFTKEEISDLSTEEENKKKAFL